MVEEDSKKTLKNANKFTCEKCDFVCSKPCDWTRHTMTRKHTMGSKMIVNGSTLVPNSSNEFN
jgi:hypothetical protein